jgi:Na+/H+-translocating membrane pyrophosphatase
MGESCKTGQAANLIFGVSVGYRSTIAFATSLAAVVYLCYELADYWGIGYAAVGIMGTLALSVVLEVSGAIFGNALAICDIAGLPDEVRDQVAVLSLSGKSVSAISKVRIAG